MQQIAACAGQSGLQPNAPWPMAFHDAAHTSATPFPGPRARPRLVATVAAGLSFGIVVAADGTVYAAEQDGLVARTSGLVEKWTLPTAPLRVRTPSIGRDGTVYASAADGTGEARLYAVDPAGQMKWRIEQDLVDVSETSIGCDGTVYLATIARAASSGWVGRFFAVTPTGAIAWTFDGPSVIGFGPTISALGTIYLDGVTALNPDGTLWWSGIRGCTNVWLARPDGTVQESSDHCAADGQLLWSSAAWLWGSLALAPDGTLLGADFQTAAVDSNGNTKWTWKAQWPNYVTNGGPGEAIVDGSGTLFFTLFDSGDRGVDPPPAPPSSMLYALDAATGAMLWSYDLGGCGPRAIAVGIESRLYLACGSSVLAFAP